MAFGFGVLRLHADAFWSLTPRELASAVAGAGGGVNDAYKETLARTTLDALMRAFPDEARS
jgi:uncharacterized phage protein (TIGR02216 family)